jgi:hypothetical protein
VPAREEAGQREGLQNSGDLLVHVFLTGAGAQITSASASPARQRAASRRLKVSSHRAAAYLRVCTFAEAGSGGRRGRTSLLLPAGTWRSPAPDARARRGALRQRHVLFEGDERVQGVRALWANAAVQVCFVSRLPVCFHLAEAASKQASNLVLAILGTRSWVAGSLSREPSCDTSLVAQAWRVWAWGGVGCVGLCVYVCVCVCVCV